MKRTPLFSAHQKLGARLVEFGGWEMPVQYTSISDEHLAVRHAAGLFDISHMGEVWVSGPAAERFLNQVLVNDLRQLAPGQGQYTLMCNERGGVVDDLYAYRLAPEQYLLIINAARIPADLAWLGARLGQFAQRAELRLEDASDATGAVAVQGPRVREFIDHCFAGPFVEGTTAARATELRKNQVAGTRFAGHGIWISRTGYTGEDGFEIVAPAAVIGAVWDRLLETGKAYGLKPAGLGARDTLRTEVCYPLYGQDLDENTTPLEAGLVFFVALDKGEFVGRPVLAEQKLRGVARRLAAFKLTGRAAPPRPHYPLWSAGPQARLLGQVSSGTHSPSLGLGIGMGYVPPEFARPQTALEVEIRGKRVGAVVVPKPIHRKAG
jgi:aminomethyltransferase